jgi:hypothetical protein
VARELRRRNPEPHFGSNHHQWLTSDTQKLLGDDLTRVEVLARQSRSKGEFWIRMRNQYCGELLPLFF